MSHGRGDGNWKCTPDLLGMNSTGAGLLSAGMKSGPFRNWSASSNRGLRPLVCSLPLLSKFRVTRACKTDQSINLANGAITSSLLRDYSLTGSNGGLFQPRCQPASSLLRDYSLTGSNGGLFQPRCQPAKDARRQARRGHTGDADVTVRKPLDLAWLENLTARIPPASHPDALGWLEARLNLKSLVKEVEQSTGRITELVKAVKSYSYMDQSPMQEVDSCHTICHFPK